jgi:hypothetical protein
MRPACLLWTTEAVEPELLLAGGGGGGRGPLMEVGRGKGMGVTPLEVGRGEAGPDEGGGQKAELEGRGAPVGDSDGV